MKKLSTKILNKGAIAAFSLLVALSPTIARAEERKLFDSPEPTTRAAAGAAVTAVLGGAAFAAGKTENLTALAKAEAEITSLEQERANFMKGYKDPQKLLFGGIMSEQEYEKELAEFEAFKKAHQKDLKIWDWAISLGVDENNNMDLAIKAGVTKEQLSGGFHWYRMEKADLERARTEGFRIPGEEAQRIIKAQNEELDKILDKLAKAKANKQALAKLNPLLRVGSWAGWTVSALSALYTGYEGYRFLSHSDLEDQRKPSRLAARI
jgi:hypothetical protein